MADPKPTYLKQMETVERVKEIQRGEIDKIRNNEQPEQTEQKTKLSNY